MTGKIGPTMILLWCFFLLGALVSGLGSALPGLARAVGSADKEFGAAFSLRGIGYLFGSWIISLTPFQGHKSPASTLGTCVLSRGEIRLLVLGMSTASMGLTGLALVVCRSLQAVCILCFVQGSCFGLVDAACNNLISVIHGEGVSPWMQGLHLSFSVGALLSPAAIGQFKYCSVFVAFSVLAIALGVISCLFAECSSFGMGERGGSHLKLEGGIEDKVVLTCNKGAGLLWEGDQEEPRELPPMDTSSCTTHHVKVLTGLDRNREGVHEGVHEEGEISFQPIVSEREERVQNKGQEETDVDWTATGTEVYVPPGKDTMDKTWDTSERDELKAIPQTLLILLMIFMFVYVGAEVGFGAWIAVVVLRAGLAGEAMSARMASLFWGGITVGRLLAVPLAVRYSPTCLLKLNLVGCLVAAAVLSGLGQVNLVATGKLISDILSEPSHVTLGRSKLRCEGQSNVLRQFILTRDHREESLQWVALGAGMYGVAMASIYPLVMSLPTSLGFSLSRSSSSYLVIGGASGEMILPAIIGQLLAARQDSQNSGQRATGVALYLICLAASVIMACVLVIVLHYWRYVEATLPARQEMQVLLKEPQYQAVNA